MKKLKIVFNFIKNDIITTFSKLTKSDIFDIIELVGFGLIVNGIYGFYREHSLQDLALVIFVLYGTLKIKNKKRKDK